MSDSSHFPELAEKLQAIRERIRQRVERAAAAPPPAPVQAPPPEMQPLNGQVRLQPSQATAIGTLNPRSAGLGNELVQGFKRTIARLSDWQLRPQREFNLAVVDALEKTRQALEAAEHNFQMLRESLQQRDEILAQREQRQQAAEHAAIRDLEALCDQITLQRWSFEGALMRQSGTVEQWKQQVEALGRDLQQLRQRVAAQAKTQSNQPPMTGASPGAAAAPSIPLDYLQLEKHFRGTEEEIRKRQSFYLPFFKGRSNVLDIACGRGEFLELMRQAGVAARGVDLDADMVGCCLEKGLEVTRADVFAYLESVPDGSLDGIFSAQFVEHLEPQQYLRLISQCAAKLAPGGVLAIETQNPECLAIFSQSFYLDPTHVRPIPPAQLRFALIEAGLERITTHVLSPASETFPVLPEFPAGTLNDSGLKSYNSAVKRFNETFFGGMDYAVIGYRPSAVA